MCIFVVILLIVDVWMYFIMVFCGFWCCVIMVSLFFLIYWCVCCCDIFVCFVVCLSVSSGLYYLCMGVFLGLFFGFLLGKMWMLVWCLIFYFVIVLVIDYLLCFFVIFGCWFSMILFSYVIILRLFE